MLLSFSEWVSVPPIEVVHAEDPVCPLDESEIDSTRACTIEDIDEEPWRQQDARLQPKLILLLEFPLCARESPEGHTVDLYAESIDRNWDHDCEWGASFLSRFN